MTHADGFYLDPNDAEVYREWSGGRWGMNVRTGPNANVVPQAAPHVGKTDPAPGTQMRNTTTTAYTPQPRDERGNGGMLGAVLWAIASVIVGGFTIATVKTGTYGGDAYTDLQNTMGQAVRALGWLIIATGALGLIVARSRR